MNVVQCWIGALMMVSFFLWVNHCECLGCGRHFLPPFRGLEVQCGMPTHRIRPEKQRETDVFLGPPKGAEPKGRTKRILILRPLTFPKGMGNVLGMAV